jgi:hypothetical protein
VSGLCYTMVQERSTAGGSNPEDGAISLTVAIGILNRNLGLADASQTTDRLGLGQRGRLVDHEPLMEALKNLFAIGKERVMAIGDIPQRQSIRIGGGRTIRDCL